MTFSQELKRQLNALSQDIAADMPRGSTAEEIAEVCLDANRLTTAGYPELDAEASAFREEHGYDNLLAEAAKHVSVY